LAGILKKLFNKHKPEVITDKEYRKLKKETEKVNQNSDEKESEETNLDPSINNPEDPEATGESDYEEDQLLEEEDTLW
jgi:hypothetical protein